MTQFDRDKLTTENVRLVYYLYEKLTKNAMTEKYKDDIISEGMVGLVKAAKNFEPARKIKFSTYASRCMPTSCLMMGTIQNTAYLSSQWTRFWQSKMISTEK